MNNYYATLGIDNFTEDVDEIKRAYRKLVRIYHPDVNKENTDGSFFREIQEAYECLSNPSKKSEYDKALSLSIQAKDVTYKVSVIHQEQPKYQISFSEKDFLDEYKTLVSEYTKIKKFLFFRLGKVVILFAILLTLVPFFRHILIIGEKISLGSLIASFVLLTVFIYTYIYTVKQVIEINKKRFLKLILYNTEKGLFLLFFSLFVSFADNYIFIIALNLFALLWISYWFYSTINNSYEESCKNAQNEAIKTLLLKRKYKK